ncbi:APH-domain-containing protein [Aspergillus ellipticus CBS 707.79]|uniref:APH-domain-containing protein n=1 Tax=Aspergillus ellipticus CBS 707.79 TaxID=1448320 RepID=A0A319D159_9EURO|nr:APH-domain-containing protein [Aspergillus ellipticus CBS 707.79]
MGASANNSLPEPFPEETIVSLLEAIGLGRPAFIKPLTVTAAFHIIYVLTYPRDAIAHRLRPDSLPSDPSSGVDLILRISGDHVPRIKTENETAILTWLRENTSIPVPDVVAFDVTTANILGHEYQITNRCPGEAISDIYDTLSPTQLDSILLQLMHMLAELHQHPFTEIGGLSFSPDNTTTTTVGPMLDEHFWFICDIPHYFPPTETFTSLNYSGPFATFTAYVTAAVNSYVHVASIHPSLQAPLHPFLPRIAAFLAALPNHASTLNTTPIYLAHKDLHFANILYDTATDRITAILDWEFAGTVPYPQWDPVRAFLWNAKPGKESFDEKYRLRDRFWELCHENGKGFLAETAFGNELQESAHLVRNSLRGITTNVPKELHPEAVEKWFKDLETGLQAFGV